MGILIWMMIVLEMCQSRLVPTWIFENGWTLRKESLDCSQLQPKSLSDQLNHKFEPSDLIWHPDRKELFVVSDHGHLASLDISGNVSRDWKIHGKPDLEGVTLIPDRLDSVYLGQEYPAAILEFDLKSETIQRTWDLQSFLDARPDTQDPNKGLESLAFIPSPHSKNHGFFYVGRQSDALIFIFDIPVLEGQVVLRGTIKPPGPGYDLSSLTVHKDMLWMLYDKDKSLYAIDLLEPGLIPTTQNIVAVDATAKPVKRIGSMSFNIRGQEGIAFVENASGSWVFVAVDAPKKAGQKNILRYTLREFFGCFSSYGLNSLPLRIASQPKKDL